MLIDAEPAPSQPVDTTATASTNAADVPGVSW